MSRNDLWFMGLFALAYLYLDSAPAALPAGESEPAPRRPLALLPPPRPIVVPRGACPRDLTHRVSLRADGAMWCLACDEAFYPHDAVLGEMMGLAAA
ncbi:MAG TPA: hypothetical protein VFL93_11735 [Longimicrobiaceae bacterium]|nr:hypothetical protein [Longimicrobiaceae bacterium]